METNKIYYGDNLKWLRKQDIFPSNFVDLIYLDPPFNSKKVYNIIYGKEKGAQAKAFEDFWFWSDETQYTYDSIVYNKNGIDAPSPIIKTIKAFHDMLSDNNLMAYLVMMTPRLLELYRVLKPTGSIYLHCDSTASHYLKIIMDSIFQTKNFRNEIIWRSTSKNKSVKRFGPIHQTILFYAKSEKSYFSPQKGPYTKEFVHDFYKESDERGRYRNDNLTGPGKRKGDSGKAWRGYNPTSVNRHWQPASYLYSKYRELTGEDLAQYPLIKRLDKLDEVGLILWPKKGKVPRYKIYLSDDPGVSYQDIWTFQPGTKGCVFEKPNIGIDDDVKWLTTYDKERLGYPTQKPEGVLERIIKSSCPEDGIVLDPFCGCGTALIVAERLKRNWIGIDITYIAVDILKQRLKKDFLDVSFEEKGAPEGITGARALAKQNRFQFEIWAITRIGGTPNQETDRGVDGLFWFRDGKEEKTGLIQVKSGKIKPGDIRDFNWTVDRENASIGIFLTLENPTKEMITEAGTGGKYKDSLGNLYSKIQIITIDEIFNGKKPDIPQLIRFVEKRDLKMRSGTKQKKL